MATLAVTPAVPTGVDLAATAACDVAGDAFPNTGKEVAFIRNTNAASRTVTIVVQATLDGQTVTNRTVTVAQNETKAIGPFPVGIYNDGNSRVVLTYSAVTNLTIKVLSIAPF